MKVSKLGNGHVGLLLLASVFLTACNPDEYYPTAESLTGDDQYCYSNGPDLNSCQAIGNRCQPAYFDFADDASQEPVFVACISNPDYVPTSGESTTGSGDGSSTAGSGDGSSTAGSGDGSSTAGSGDGSSTAGSGDGSTTTGSGDGSTGGSTGGSVEVPPPTIREALDANCNIDQKYLWIKTITSKKKSEKQVKVKVCHATSNGSAHTIIIACPALKAHVKHHDDTVGACSYR